MAYREKWFNDTRSFGLDSKMLSTREVASMMPELSGPIIGGLFTASDGHAEPRKVAPAFAQRAVRS